MAVLLRFEVAMKRPGDGLLKRMLRLMEVDHKYALVQGKPTRVLSLQYGAEYHIGLQILKSPLLNSSTECAAEWLSISMPGCLPLRFQVETVDHPGTVDIIISHPSWRYDSGGEHVPACTEVTAVCRLPENWEQTFGQVVASGTRQMVWRARCPTAEIPAPSGSWH